jgi:dipeptidyl aminopeptidase/acylaminoacyl peptidase
MTDYARFLPSQRLERSVSLSADGTQVAFASDASGQFNVYAQPAGGGPARQLTSFTDRAVHQVAWTPDNSAVAFTADTGGDEENQVYLVPAEGGEPVRLSAADGRHALAEKTAFSGSGRFLLYSGPADAGVTTCDLESRSEVRFPGPPGTLVFAVAISPDGSQVLAGAIVSNIDCQCYLAPTASPGAALVPVTTDLPGEYYYPGPWTRDGSSFYVLTTGTDGEHTCLALFALAGKTLTIIDNPPWDVEDVVVSGDGRTVIWSVNEDGYSRLRARRDGIDLHLPPVPDGVLRSMSVSHDGGALALIFDTPTRPASVLIVSPGTDQPARYLNDTTPAGIQPAGPELIRYPASDGTLVPAWLYRPHGTGPFPVVVSVHGGPDQQARPRYDAIHQCLVDQGIAVLVPNIRGSSGYGLSWQKRIYRDWGGIDLEDLASARAWLAAQPWCISSKIAVFGESYGGFVTLSCLARQPDLWAAGAAGYGPANLLTLATSMPASWAGAVAAMFGDPDDPDNAADLARRSPVTYAAQIKAPLLVFQGANDPRTPKAESDQIIAAARANGADPDYLLFGDEGHGFTSRDNDIKAYTAVTEFLARHLLG